MNTRHGPDSDALDAGEGEEAALELQTALEQSGFASMRMCATGEISPDAMRAIAASIRSLDSGGQNGPDRLSIPSEGRL